HRRAWIGPSGRATSIATRTARRISRRCRAICSCRSRSVCSTRISMSKNIPTSAWSRKPPNGRVENRRVGAEERPAMRNFAPSRRCLASLLPLAGLVLLLAQAAHAQAPYPQDTSDQKRCTGEWRANVDERIAACTTLISSGHYQTINLAILHDNRGEARCATHDLDGAIADLDQAITLNPSDVSAYRTRGNAYDQKGDLDQAIDSYGGAIRLA